MDESEQHSPIPIPRGSYNINFDDFDEFSNPFQTKSKMGNSPTQNNDVNPFQTKSKLGSSPPQTNNNIYDVEKSSPDRQEEVEKNQRSPADGASDESPVCESEKLAAESQQQEGQTTQSSCSPKSTAEPDTQQQEEQTSLSNDSVDKKDEKKSPSKKTVTKKGIKKPKAKSKFKPPANFGAQSDDIQIFAPPPNTQTTAEPEQSEPPRDNEVTNIPDEITSTSSMPDDITSTTSMPDDLTAAPVPEAGFEPDLVSSGSHMAQSLEMVHDFGAAEMPDSDENEGFVPANEIFTDTADWEMMEKFGGHGEGDNNRPSILTNFDPLIENKNASTNNTRNETFDDTSKSEDLLLMNTPPQNKTSRVPKHPAARVLEEHVEENGNAEQQQVDRMLGLSPGKSDENKHQSPDDSEAELKYYDAYDFPPSARDRSWVPKNDSAAANKMENQDSIVQLVQVLKYSQSDWNKMKQDLELEFQAKLLNKEKEWSRKLADRDKTLTQLEDQNKSLKQSNQDMRCVVAEFEKTIAQLQAEKEKTNTESQHSLEDIVRERDQAVEDLQSVENAFSDLHRRYEKTKGVVEGFKKNEEVLKKCVQDYQAKLKKSEDKVQAVKQQAEEKLDMANNEIERTKKSTTADIARLEAALRKSEIRVQGLESSIDQKVRENEELTAICDELIAKVGTD